MTGKLRSLLLIICGTILLSSGCGQPSIDDSVLAQIVMLEDQRNPDMNLFQDWLEDENPLVRERALLALGRIGVQDRPDPYYSSIVEILEKDRDAAVRAMAAFALGEIEDHAGADALIAAFAVRDETVRATAAEAVTKLQGKPGAQALANLIRTDESDLVRERALLYSFRLESDLTAKEAMRILHEGPEALRWPAAYHLMRHKRASMRPWKTEFVAKLAEDADPRIRKAAASFIRHLSDRVASGELLEKLLVDDDMDVQTVALSTASRIGYVGIIPLILDYGDSAALHTRISMMNATAALAAGLISQDIVAEEILGDCSLIFLRALRDKDQAVAAIAVRGLAALGSRSLELIEVNELFSDPRPQVRAAAVSFIPLLPADEQEERIRRMLQDDANAVRTSAGIALQNLTAEFVEPLQAELLATGDQVQVSLAASYYSRNPSEEGMNQLLAAYERFTDDPDPEAMAGILGALSGYLDEQAEVREVMEQAMESPHYMLRYAAARVLEPVAGEEMYSKVGTNQNGRDLAWYQNALSVIRKYQGMTVHTDRGEIKLTFNHDDAPLTIYNFIKLAEDSFFDDTVIHRVIPEFVAQMGDPRGDGWGGPGYQIRCEIAPSQYYPGAVGMAHAGKDTGGSQFFIAYAAKHHLDGGHTIFAQVTAGMEVATALSNGAILKSISLLPANQ